MVFSPKPTLTIRGPQGSGGGGSLQISSDRDDQMGAKVKTPKKSLDENLTPKKSLANFPSHKNFQSNYSARIHGNCHESSDCFEYPKKSLLKSSLTAKNTCQNFPTWKIQKKLRSCIPVTWNLEHPPGSWTQALTNTSYWPLWSRHLNLPGGHFFLVTGGFLWNVTFISRTPMRNFLWCYITGD